VVRYEPGDGALPLVVELDNDGIFFQDGYFYSHRNNIWFFSMSREGPWRRLPRNHYLREFRYRDHGDQGRFEHHGEGQYR
jgi:hypothetical protein